MYRFTIDRNDLGNFRNTTIEDKLVELTPDGFTCETVEQGKAICERHGWAYSVEAE